MQISVRMHKELKFNGMLLDKSVQIQLATFESIETQSLINEMDK